MELPLRSALINWLRADPELAEINAIEEEIPRKTSPPWLTISASAARDWSTKDRRGREVRMALELDTRSDSFTNQARLVDAIERRTTRLPDRPGSFDIASIRFLRSRHQKRSGNRRATLLEFRFRVFQPPSE